MSRTVLTYPDLPTVLTPSVAASTYLPLAGGTLTGNLGIGVTPEATWATGYKVLRIGQVGALMSADAAMSSTFVSNMRWDGTNNRALVTGVGVQAQLYNGELNVYTAPSVAAGAVQTPTLRLKVNTVGTLTLTPDASTVALATGSLGVVTIGSVVYFQIAGSNYFTLDAASGQNFISGHLPPRADRGGYLGLAAYRWDTVYAFTGAINTSIYEAKQDFSPLEPALCAQAVLDTDWVNFRYLPPPYQEPPEQEGQAPGDRQRAVDESKVAHAKMLVETQPARDQKGYVLQSPEHQTHDLFGLSDRQSASPSSDLAVVACALQHALTEIAALKAQIGASA